VTYGGCLPKALKAAEDVDGEVIDLRVLRPLDMAPVVASVKKTRRVVVIDEGWRSGGLAAEVMARIMEQAFYELDAPVARVCSEEVPVPYAKHMEEATLPQVEDIVAAAKGLYG
jgi:pyruvate dehydrogenase E1 component beta subunit